MNEKMKKDIDANTADILRDLYHIFKIKLARIKTAADRIIAKK
jgi:hypothetical protein